jgi:hypothetical protein
MSEQFSKHDHVLMSLIMNLQAIAMVQLGKVVNPTTGEVERDVDAARGTIDLLEMLKVKCRTDTPADLLKMLDHAVMELQMNYLDELKKERHQDEPADEKADEAAAGEAADTAGADAPAGEDTDA